MKDEKEHCENNSAALDALAASGKTNTKLLEDFVAEQLADVFKERKLKKIDFERVIFSRIGNGFVASGSVVMPDDFAESDRSSKSLPVGFLINTMRLVDPVSRRALEPGASLVEMRSLGGGKAAFDYVGGDGKIKIATDTQRPTDAGGPSGLTGDGGPGQEFDIEVNHVLRAPGPNDLLPCGTICTSYHDGTEKCFYACDEEDVDLGFTIGA